jgi:hypothetical protein
MKANPASTQAPENYLSEGIKYLNSLTLISFGILIIIDHPDVEQIMKTTHRFNAKNEEGLFGLAKNLYKIVGERIDSKKIKEIIGVR